MANNTTSDTAQEDHTLATTVALETVCLTKEAVRNRWGYLLIGLLITGECEIPRVGVGFGMD